MPSKRRGKGEGNPGIPCRQPLTCLGEIIGDMPTHGQKIGYHDDSGRSGLNTECAPPVDIWLSEFKVSSHDDGVATLSKHLSNVMQIIIRLRPTATVSDQEQSKGHRARSSPFGLPKLPPQVHGSLSALRRAEYRDGSPSSRQFTMIGVRLGPWIIERELGRGGMGAVYLARRAPDISPGPPRAAIKVLAAELAVEVGFQQRFKREIDILRQLDHPNVVKFLESGHDESRYWFAMEYVPGQSFEDLRDERGRVPWPLVLDLACQIAPALKHAHDRGIIHRDLKPSNLLRAPTDPSEPESTAVIKLTDFGIASLFASPHLTVTGGIIGTPEYLSPEQAAGKPVTKKSDLYSLGVVLYTLVTGNTPFTGTPVELLHKHRFGQFDRPGKIIVDLPGEFDDIICNLLEKDPSNRPGDGQVLFRQVDALRRKLTRIAAAETHLRDATVAEPGARGREGPATLMSRLMRQELENQNRGGPVWRFFNQAWVLTVLFIVCVGVLIWTFWPLSPKTMYRRGAVLMTSEDPSDWDLAWQRYLGPLEEKYPDHPYQQEVALFKQQYEAYLAERKATRAAKLAKTPGEGQWFFEQGLRLRQRGDEAGARRIWRALIAAFGDLPAEKPWVSRARNELQRDPPAETDPGLASVRLALERARKYEKSGQIDEARAIRRGLQQLYSDDSAARKLIESD